MMANTTADVTDVLLQRHKIRSDRAARLHGHEPERHASPRLNQVMDVHDPVAAMADLAAVGGVSTANIAGVGERATREIGIRKACGVRRRDILVVLIEAIGPPTGGIPGILLGWGITVGPSGSGRGGNPHRDHRGHGRDRSRCVRGDRHVSVSIPRCGGAPAPIQALHTNKGERQNVLARRPGPIILGSPPRPSLWRHVFWPAPAATATRPGPTAATGRGALARGAGGAGAGRRHHGPDPFREHGLDHYLGPRGRRNGASPTTPATTLRARGTGTRVVKTVETDVGSPTWAAT
jgi:hypothetical protein